MQGVEGLKARYWLSMAQSYGSFCSDNAWRRVLSSGVLWIQSREQTRTVLPVLHMSRRLMVLNCCTSFGHEIIACVHTRDRQNGVCRKLCLNIMPPGRVIVVGSSGKYASTLCPSGIANCRKRRFSNQTSQSHFRKRRIVQFQTETSRRGLFCTLLSCF